MMHGRCGWFAGALAALLLAGCRDETEPAEEPLAVDMSGEWAGTWSGSNTQQGYVTGTWEASVTQTASGVTGSVVLGGDVDCPDATLTGSLAGEIVSGKIERPPCYPNEWTMTALDLVRRTTSGVWIQPAWGGQGTFTGAQIARRGGPHISFFGPTAGRPGTIVTIVGRGFDDTPEANLVEFGGIPATVIRAALETLTVVVPEGAETGRIALTTAYGTTMSPRPFDADARHPDPTGNSTIEVGSSPEGIAFGADGRRVYVANRESGTLTMIDARVNLALRTTPVHAWLTPPVQGVAASPDGRRVYVASGEQGVAVFADTALSPVVDTIPVAAGGSAGGLNPQGVAVSPDGRTLYVSDDRDGGAVSVVDVATKEVVASFSRGPGAVPAGVAASPDGRTAFLAFAGPDVVDVLDAETLVTIAAVSVAARPVGLAVTPDGAKVYVTSATAGSVTVFDATYATTVIMVGASPRGIAISADGTGAYVANEGDGTVSVVDVATGSVVDTIPVCPSPVGIAMSPDGKRAFASCAGVDSIREIGGPYTLTIAKLGTGYGTVTSSPEGLLCGPSCQARFDRDSVVTLSASADASSYFGGWGGDGCGVDGTVTMNDSRTCTATFMYLPSGGYGGSPGYCFIATAAYGSGLAREVQVLREFRDRRLLTNAPGRAFVRAYYALSPPIARAIAGRDGLRAAVRGSLAVVVWAVERPRDALLSAAAAALAALLALRLRRRSARCTP